MITNEQATICARAANASYGKPTVPGGYTPVETFDGFDPKTGFNAVLYQKDGTDEYIVAFTGTQPSTSQDVVADLALGMTQWEAKRDEVINYLKNNIDASKITFTGHSLGGALAQYATYDLIKILNDSGMDIPAIDLVTFAALGGMDGVTDTQGCSAPAEFILAAKPVLTQLFFSDIVNRFVVKALQFQHGAGIGLDTPFRITGKLEIFFKTFD